MSRHDREPVDGGQSVPPGLRADLQALYRPPAVPAAVDEQIHFRAAQRLSDFRRTRRWGGMAIAAAVVLMVFGLERALQTPPAPPPSDVFIPGVPQPTPLVQSASPGPGDIDGSGQIDILDALVLARRVEAGSAAESRWDLNADGRVDRHDAEVVARQAVRLIGGDS